MELQLASAIFINYILALETKLLLRGQVYHSRYKTTLELDVDDAKISCDSGFFTINALTLMHVSDNVIVEWGNKIWY